MSLLPGFYALWIGSKGPEQFQPGEGYPAEPAVSQAAMRQNELFDAFAYWDADGRLRELSMYAFFLNYFFAGTGIDIDVDLVGPKITISATGGFTEEQIEDLVGALVQDSSVLDVTYDDALDVVSLTIKAGAVTNAMLAGSIAWTKLAAPAASFDFNAQKFTNHADPSDPQDVATKNYVDTELAGVGGGSVETPTLYNRIREGWHFLQGIQDTPFVLSTVGSGVANLGNGTVGHPGQLSLGSAVSATGGGAVFNNNIPFVTGAGGGAMSFEWYFRTQVLPTVAQAFTLRVGVMNGVFAAFTAGMTIELSQADAQFQCVTRTTAVLATTTDSGVTAVANQWYRGRIDINAAGTEVKFYIDDVLVATHTTHITTTNIGQGAYHVKTAGTSFTTTNVDSARCEWDA